MKKLLLLCLLLTACGSVKNIETRIENLRIEQRTPKGALVKTEKGVTVTLDELNAIDTGLDNVFIKARKCGYSRAMLHDDYIVAYFDDGVKDSNGDPAFKVPAGKYAKTEWDKGGYILAAGQTVYIGEPFGNVMAIPKHYENFAHLSLIVDYEGEHILAAWNDGVLFDRTQFHGQGQGHPILNCG